MRFPIYKYAKAKGKWRYCPAVLDRGMPVSNMVLVDGVPEHHPEGSYYVRQGSGDERKWIPAGETPQSAMDTVVKLADPQPATEEFSGTQPVLWQQAARFLESYNVGKQAKTRYGMEQVLERFKKTCKAARVQDVNKDDVRSYWEWEVEHSPTKSLRTAHNRVTTLGAFLKENGIDVLGRGKNAKGELRWQIPPFDEEVPEVYEQWEIDAIMGASDARHRAAYSTMLMALLREKEAVYLTWNDINVQRSTIAVKSKPQYGWRVKKNRERVVKVPKALIEMIDTLPRTSSLVFGKDDGEPDLHLLRHLKCVAQSVRLDPDRCWLHKFRASGATTLLRSGMSLTDVMHMGGWRDVASVQRYLAPLQGDRLEKAVEAAWATA